MVTAKTDAPDLVLGDLGGRSNVKRIARLGTAAHVGRVATRSPGGLRSFRHELKSHGKRIKTRNNIANLEVGAE